MTAQRTVIASTDPDVMETQKRLETSAKPEAPANGSTQKEPEKKRRRRRSTRSQSVDTRVDLTELSSQARAFTQAAEKVWVDLTESDDILARAFPFLLIGGGLALGIARYLAKKRDEEGA